MLRGMATVSFFAADVAAAQRWYTELLGVGAYFVRPEPPDLPGYIEFRVGDYQHELGIIDSRYAPPSVASSPGGAVVFWHVDDLRETHAKLLAMGATEYQPPTDREAGFVTAAVLDPFGNILGIMHNPHYLDILAAGTAS